MPTRPLSERDYYTTAEMARSLGCCQQTVIRRIDRGLIPAFRLPDSKPGNQSRRGRMRRCRKAEFREYLADCGIPADALNALEHRARLAEAFGPGRQRRG